jgi:zinc transport system permease protein
MAFLEPDFMRRALVAAVLVGLTAPAIGTYLVQRRLALMGDGIGHVALTGVALGFLLGTAPLATALVLAVAGAVAIELLRERGAASGDVALALLFYGGIAGGVLLIGLAGASSASLVGYLFGSLSSVRGPDLAVVALLCAAVLGVVGLFRRELFAVCQDEEVARVSGLPVRSVNLLVAVTAAVTVTVAMRVVGLLLVSALMIVPVAVGQLVTHSFRRTMLVASVVGVVVCLAGLTITYWNNVSPGATIVVLAIGVYVVTAIGRPLLARRRPAGDPHPDIPDDVEVDDREEYAV